MYREARRQSRSQMRSDIDEAISLLKEGEVDALDKALSLLNRSVFAFGMRVCGHQQDAEDTMQEVLLKAVPYLGKFDNSKALATWLYKVVKNRCLMSRRKSKSEPKQSLSLDELMPDKQELADLEGSSAINPESAAILDQREQLLREAIRNVPPHYRIVLVLRDMEGFTNEEVGEITGLRPGTIRVRLHRARLFVRRELARHRGQARRRSRPHSPAVAGSGRCRKMFAGLSDYLEGELDDFSCAEIETHMNRCEPCKQFLQSLEQSIQRCRELPAQCPDQRRATEMRKQLLSTYSRALATGGK